MSFFAIHRGSEAQREAVRSRLEGLDGVAGELAEAIVTAWVSAWLSSSHERLDDMPYSPQVTNYPLLSHTNDVIGIGLALARQAKGRWEVEVGHDRLYAILALHDIDKPLLYARQGEGFGTTPLYEQVPHGVVGAFLLRDLGFEDVVVSTVATHAVNAPFHGSNPEAWILHYADMFASDHILPDAGLVPFYRRHR